MIISGSDSSAVHAGVAEPGAQTASLGAAGAFPGHGSLGSGPGPVCRHLPVCAQAAADNSARPAPDPGLHLDQDPCAGQNVSGGSATSCHGSPAAVQSCGVVDFASKCLTCQDEFAGDRWAYAPILVLDTVMLLVWLALLSSACLAHLYADQDHFGVGHAVHI